MYVEDQLAWTPFRLIDTREGILQQCRQMLKVAHGHNGLSDVIRGSVDMASIRYRLGNPDG